MSDSLHEMHQPCAIYPSREAAEKAAARLTEAGIAFELAPPGERTHGLAAGSCQISVPGASVARARAILSAADGS